MLQYLLLLVRVDVALFGAHFFVYLRCVHLFVDGTRLAGLVNDDDASSVKRTFPMLHQILGRLAILCLWGR